MTQDSLPFKGRALQGEGWVGDGSELRPHLPIPLLTSPLKGEELGWSSNLPLERVLPGGDYGFAFTPHCQNARDLEFFVKYLGFTPMEALVAATRHGGEAMMRGGDLGQVKEGFLADLLLVDGDPLTNLSLLREPGRILAVMKDGVFYKKPELQAARMHRSLSAA